MRFAAILMLLQSTLSDSTATGAHDPALTLPNLRQSTKEPLRARLAAAEQCKVGHACEGDAASKHTDGPYGVYSQCC